MKKQLMIPGGILWILGLILSIAGMNIPSREGKLIAVIGNILFLIGLGLTGAAWLIARKKAEQEKKEE